MAGGLVVGVYGTLRRGLRNHHLLAGRAEPLGTASVAGELFEIGTAPLRPYRYPALLPGEGTVRVELYRLASPDVLAELDVLEAYHPADETGSEYVRRELPLSDVDPPGVATRAWVYLFNAAPDLLGPPVTGGDWSVHEAAEAPPADI